jgi:uncharacterized protein YkwD
MLTRSISARARLYLATCIASISFPFVASGQQLKKFDPDYLTSPRGGPDLARAEEAIFRLTNEFRKEQGQTPLKWNKALDGAAAYFAAYMARTDKFGHTTDGNEPTERMTAYGYDSCVDAENIAHQRERRGVSTGALAQKFFEIWRDSPPHRENMLAPDLTEIGIAIGYSPASNRYYAVQNFGRPASAAIKFEVTNRTSQTLQFTVRMPVDRGNSEPERIELPARMTMWHTSCGASTIDWSWTKVDDRVRVADHQTFVVDKSGSEFRVSQQQSTAANVKKP